jgi:hypothetical protein
MPQIAWSPSSNPRLNRVGAVLLSPKQPLDRQMYLSLLADRVQAMVDRSPDPKQAAAMLHQQMVDAGLAMSGSLTPEQVGEKLVMSNPDLWERLDSLHLLEHLKTARPIESPDARTELQLDLQTPLLRLQGWASALTL